MSEAARKKQLVIFFDFDDTLVDGNSEFSTFPMWTPSLNWLCLGYYMAKGRWNDYVQKVFDHHHSHGVTKEQLFEIVERVRIGDGMEELLRALKTELDPPAEVVVMSNSNTLFIEHLLRKFGVDALVDKVLANPAEFEASGRLKRGSYAKPGEDLTCPTCPWPLNMCKGRLLNEYLDGRRNSGEQLVVAFCGDGSNDVCAMLALREADLALPRRGYSADKRLAKRTDVKATVLQWANGKDILEAVRNVAL